MEEACLKLCGRSIINATQGANENMYFKGKSTIISIVRNRAYTGKNTRTPTERGFIAWCEKHAKKKDNPVLYNTITISRHFC